MLADLGADVIKVEPPEGDSMRYVLRQPARPTPAEGTSKSRPGDAVDYTHQMANRGKRSVAIDMNTEEGQLLVRELARGADVFLTNLTPPRLRRFGVGPETLRAENERLIFASVTGWGLRGPKADENSFDVTAFFAHGGVMSLQGEPGDNPCKPIIGQGDMTTGLAALGSILSALLLRERTGKGSTAEASLLRTATWTVGCDLSCALLDGAQPKQRDRFDTPNVMANTYRCADGKWLILVMPFPRYWPKFCAALAAHGATEDAAAWAADGHQFATPRGRSRARAELTRLLDARFASAPLADWASWLDASGCIWSPLQDMPALAADEQAEAAGAYAWVSHPTAGRFRTVNTPFGVDAGVGARVVGARGPGPEVGQHTSAVLAERLGLGEARVRELQERGIVGHRPLKGSPLERWAKVRAAAAAQRT